MSDHFRHAFCTGELCPGLVSIKLLPYYTFLENITSGVRPEISNAQSAKGNLTINIAKYVYPPHLALFFRDNLHKLLS